MYIPVAWHQATCHLDDLVVSVGGRYSNATAELTEGMLAARACEPLKAAQPDDLREVLQSIGVFWTVALSMPPQHRAA